MAVAILFVLLMAGLFGALLVSLVAGIFRAAMEARPARRRALAREAPSTIREVPGFFATTRGLTPTLARGTQKNDELIDRLQGQLQAEQALVARFLVDPSIDSLYRQASASLPIN